MCRPRAFKHSKNDTHLLFATQQIRVTVKSDIFMNALHTNNLTLIIMYAHHINCATTTVPYGVNLFKVYKLQNSIVAREKEYWIAPLVLASTRPSGNKRSGQADTCRLVQHLQMRQQVGIDGLHDLTGIHALLTAEQQACIRIVNTLNVSQRLHLAGRQWPSLPDLA